MGLTPSFRKLDGTSEKTIDKEINLEIKAKNSIQIFHNASSIMKNIAKKINVWHYWNFLSPKKTLFSQSISHLR